MTRSNLLYLGHGLVVMALAVLLGFASLPGQLLAADASAAFAEPTTEAKPALRVVEIPVEGMACVSCAASVKHAVKSLNGVIRVEVSLEKRNARVTYFANLLTPDRIVAAIDKLGYTAGTPKDAP
jgi:copper chaperone CopZ